MLAFFRQARLEHYDNPKRKVRILYRKHDIQFMKHHSLVGFYFDDKITTEVYDKLNLKFENSDLKAFCYPFIEKAISEYQLALGIDLEKPWEELVMDNYYQIEYLFSGKLSDTMNIIEDSQIGINIYEEHRFGRQEFGTDNILNLAFLIDRP